MTLRQQGTRKILSPAQSRRGASGDGPVASVSLFLSRRSRIGGKGPGAMQVGVRGWLRAWAETAGVSIAVVVVSACGSAPGLAPPPASPSASPSTAAGAGVIPWVALAPPTPTESPQRAGAAPGCPGANVTGSTLQFAGLAAGSEGFAGTITSDRSAPCSVPAEPAASFYDADARAIALRHSPGVESAPVVLSRTSASASVALVFGDWCAAAPVQSMAMDLGNGAVVRLRIVPFATTTASRCAGEATYALTLAPEVAAATSPQATDQLSPVLTVQGPATPGQPYRYLVTISNDGAVPVPWPPCPVYVAGLKSVAGASERYQLDCSGLAPLPPGQAQTFEMYLPIPASAKPGTYGLTWWIEGSPFAATEAVTIR